MRLFCQLMIWLLLGGLLSSCHRNAHLVGADELPSFVTQKGSKYVITQGDTQIEILGNTAARVSSLKVAGQELMLTPSQSNKYIWGSTFWSSPQSEWSWPPLETLDTAAYSVSVANNRLVFTSRVDKKTGYQFVKSYGVNTEKKCISIIYSIYNHSAQEKSVAGWELTRMPPTGITFFPRGNTDISNGIFYPLPVENIDGITWAAYDASKIQNNQRKLMTDGKDGWLAYVNKGKLFVREFADVPVELIVSGEGEIEIFASADNFFWELAQQGVMTKLAPGEHLDWEVLWHTRSLPKDIPEKTGSAELVNYVRGVLSGQN